MVGMNHAGDADYLNQINTILDQCDYVLYENIRPESREGVHTDECKDALYNAAFNDDSNVAYLAAMQLFFIRSDEVFNLEREEKFFDYTKKHWLFADITEDDIDPEEYEQRAMGALDTISFETRQEIALYMQKTITELDKGNLTKKDLRDAFIFPYNLPKVTEVFLKAMETFRDEIVFKHFDKLFADKDQEIIAIKHGAGHMAHQREMLEARGYVKKDSLLLRNIAFEDN